MSAVVYISQNVRTSLRCGYLCKSCPLEEQREDRQHKHAIYKDEFSCRPQLEGMFTSIHVTQCVLYSKNSMFSFCELVILIGTISSVLICQWNSRYISEKTSHHMKSKTH